jgi:molybdopterin synthase sulfur carrier subunit
MPVVWIPALLRPLTAGQDRVAASGTNLRAVIDDLESRYPGLRDRLCDGPELRSGLAVVIDGGVVRSGLETPVGPASEIHFVHAIGGGQSQSDFSEPRPLGNRKTHRPASNNNESCRRT